MQQSVDEMKRQLEKTTVMINQALQGNNLNNNGVPVPVTNQDIIIVGGFYARGDGSVSNTAETFNILEEKSTQLPSMNIARGGSASCVYNGDVIITGSYDGKDGTESIEILKMKNQDPLRWTMFDGKLPVKLSSHVVIVYQDKLYVTGGKNWNEKKVSDCIHELTLTPPYTYKLLCHNQDVITAQWLSMVTSMSLVERQQMTLKMLLIALFMILSRIRSHHVHHYRTLSIECPQLLGVI